MFRKLHLYKSLDTLRILTFWKIIKDNNPLLLDKEYFDGKKYSKSKLKEINNTWQLLYDEYFILRDDSISKREFEKHFDGLILKARILNLYNIIKAFDLLKNDSGTIPDKYIQEKRLMLYKQAENISKKIKVQYFNDLDLDIDYLIRFYNSMQNSYNLNYKPKQQVDEKQIKNVYDIVANIESWLERSIDIETLSVEHWLAYEKQVNTKQKLAKQKDGK